MNKGLLGAVSIAALISVGITPASAVTMIPIAGTNLIEHLYSASGKVTWSANGDDGMVQQDFQPARVKPSNFLEAALCNPTTNNTVFLDLPSNSSLDKSFLIVTADYDPADESIEDNGNQGFSSFTIETRGNDDSPEALSLDGVKKYLDLTGQETTYVFDMSSTEYAFNSAFDVVQDTNIQYCISKGEDENRIHSFSIINIYNVPDQPFDLEISLYAGSLEFDSKGADLRVDLNPDTNDEISGYQGAILSLGLFNKPEMSIRASGGASQDALVSQIAGAETATSSSRRSQYTIGGYGDEIGISGVANDDDELYNITNVLEDGDSGVDLRFDDPDGAKITSVILDVESDIQQASTTPEEKPYTAPDPYDGPVIGGIYKPMPDEDKPEEDGVTQEGEADKPEDGGESFKPGDIGVITGENLDEVEEVQVGEEDAPIEDQKPGQIDFQVPDLPPGDYPVRLITPGGIIQFQDPITVVDDPVARAIEICDGKDPKAWTQRQSKTEAKFYIKCPEVGSSYSVYFQRNGGAYEQVFSKTPASLDDAGQRFGDVGRYYVRTFDISEKIRIRIFFEDEKQRQVVYNLDSWPPND